jgi:magnesium-transporting ATPase (P-type)
VSDEQTPPSGSSAYSGARARSEAKNQAVRDSLEPLAPGERPGAVTVAAVVALMLAIANFVIYLFADHASGPDHSREVMQTLLICAVLLAAAVGMWKAKYWAVLGFQTILGLQVLFLALALLKVSKLWVALLFLAIIALSSVLFWYLIRAMARIQMPEAPELKSRTASGEEEGKNDG